MPLELDQDLSFQHTQWIVQRISWGLLGGLILAGLFGGFGSGPLSHAVHSTGAITLAYDRLLRQGKPSSFNLQLVSSETKVQIFISKNYMDRVSLEKIVPEPYMTNVSQEGYTYHFTIQPQSSPRIIFEFHPITSGYLSGVLLINKNALPLRHLVFP